MRNVVCGRVGCLFLPAPVIVARRVDARARSENGLPESTPQAANSSQRARQRGGEVGEGRTLEATSILYQPQFSTARYWPSSPLEYYLVLCVSAT